MPLLNTTQLVNARIAELSKNMAAHLSAAAIAANDQAAAVMSLSDADLTTWLRDLGAETQQLFAAHEQLGIAVNGALQVAAGVLASTGIAVNPTPVDTRSVPEKLAAQRREITVDKEGVPTVITHPEPEPAPEP